MHQAAAPTPDREEARDNATFEAILWALARPGDVRRLPQPGLITVAMALVDGECAVYADTPDHLANLALRGADIVRLGAADHVFLEAPEAFGAQPLADLATGDLLYPDRGATLCLTGRIDEGARLRLTGPGIDGAGEARIGGLPDGFWAARAGLCRYPLGVEVLVVDGDRLLAIPRSTLVEEL